MGNIRKLAGQTMWYGVSSIVARFLFYLLTPYFIVELPVEGYGDFSLIYAAIPFLNVIFTYGLETAYFRFATQEKYKNDVYNTAIISIISTTVVFTIILIIARHSIAHLLRLDKHPEYITIAALIIAFDTLSALPFAKLRLDERPRKYALIRVVTIVFQIAVTYFLLSIAPQWAREKPDGFFATFYDPSYKVGYVIIANLMASVFGWLLLWKEFNSFHWRFNLPVWKTMMIYSLPLIIAGLGGMINETFDRIMLNWWAPISPLGDAKSQVAIYSACYKLSILITLFIQAFRMAAEPFFFNQSQGQEPQKVYARVMKFFVITVSVMFLVVAMYLDVWKYFLGWDPDKRKIYEQGFSVVPVLLLANIFLGIYYNLSIWYKLTNQTMTGAWITVIGAIITIAINYFFIPKFSFAACAWATFLCYGSMMVISYIWGQKEYPVPYAWKKLLAYIAIAVILFWIHKLLNAWTDNFVYSFTTATILLLSFLWFLIRIERKEFAKLPVVGRYIK